MGSARTLAVLAFLSAAPAAAAPPLAIVDVDVVPMDAERLLTHRTVIVSGDTIARVGPLAAVYVPDDAVVIKGRGLTLVPGMADMHAHLPGPEGLAMPIDDYLFLQVARGVTTVRSMRGSPEHVALRERVNKGALLGPELVLGSQAVISKAPLTLEAARALVAAARRQKVEFVKLVSVGSAEDYKNLLAAAREEYLPIAGHVPASVGLDLAIASRQRSIEHIEPFIGLPDDDEAVKKLATQLLQGGTYLCPTLDYYAVHWLRHDDAALERRPGLEYIPKRVRAGWAAELARLRAAAASSGEGTLKLRRLESVTHLLARLAHFRVPLLVGPGDGPYIVPGFGMQHELRALVDAGLSPYVALRSATHDAAAALDNRPFGTVKKGRRADLVLVAGNPLASIDAMEKVRGVILRGRWIPPEEIDAGLARIAAAARTR